MGDISTATALWWAVVASGLYHGVNPGMGWPLTVSAALMERRAGSLWRALAALAAGHLLAMTLILVAFSVLIWMTTWHREIRIVAAGLVIGLGVYLLISPRHPRFLARVPPSRLALWSFLVAMAHGAGLMLVPIHLGLSHLMQTGAGQAAAFSLMSNSFIAALAVALLHTLAMTAAGGVLAWGVYRWLGLKFLSKSWFNLDIVWALSLILVGLVSLLAVL